jgi:hypothetical protein
VAPLPHSLSVRSGPYHAAHDLLTLAASGAARRQARPPPQGKSIRRADRHDADAEPAASRLERRLSDKVIQSYPLSKAEIDLHWRTVPPRIQMLG